MAKGSFVGRGKAFPHGELSSRERPCADGSRKLHDQQLRGSKRNVQAGEGKVDEFLFITVYRVADVANVEDVANYAERLSTRSDISEPLTCGIVHECPHVMQFLAAEGRHVYTTPKSFLELLRLFTSLLESKRIEVDAAVQRLEGGMLKLAHAAEAVAYLEENLKVIVHYVMRGPWYSLLEPHQVTSLRTKKPTFEYVRRFPILHQVKRDSPAKIIAL